MAATAGGASAYVPYNWQKPFIDGLSTSQRTPLTLLTDHFYIGSANDTPAPAVADLANWNIVTTSAPTSPPYNVVNFTTGTAAVLKRICTSDYPGLPWRLAESNSYWSGGKPGVSDAFVSALWVIDYLFTVACFGAAGVNFHGGNHSIYSPLFDDENLTVIIANPMFYGMKFFNMALDQTHGTGTLLTSTVDTWSFGDGTTTANISAYCVQTSATSVSVLLINKSTTYYFNPTVTLPFHCVSATAVELTTTGNLGSLNWDGTNFTAASYNPTTMIQGETVVLPAGTLAAGTPYNLTTPVYTAGTGTSTVAFWLPMISAVLVTITITT